MGWAIALHGGAGDFPLSLLLERREPQEATLRCYLEIGVDALKASRSPLDVVELVSRFQGWKGSLLTSNGTLEMETCTMDGNTKNCGAISGLSSVKNAVSLERLVMEKTPHIYLGFDGEEAFAREGRFSRVYLSKGEESESTSPSRVLSQFTLVEEAWVPFYFGLDGQNERNHSGSSVDSSVCFIGGSPGGD
ncbi:hypothetical protein ACS0TY_029866 [Phlomoides rotata]